MTPHRGETLFSSVPTSNSLISVTDPWGAFWADTGGLQGPLTRLLCCFQNYRHTRTLCAVLDMEVLGHPHEQMTFTSILPFLEHTCFSRSKSWSGLSPPILDPQVDWMWFLNGRAFWNPKAKFMLWMRIRANVLRAVAQHYSSLCSIVQMASPNPRKKPTYHSQQEGI